MKKHPGRRTHWAEFDSWMAKTDNYVEAIKKRRASQKAANKKKQSPKKKGLQK